MSYTVLARKWRPKNFSQLVGQTHVMQALSNALDQQRLHHAYLFTGTRGVGKTTIARIFAKALNCEQGISSQPCGQCSVCQAIDEGRFVDLIEVDAASRTKVEDTREILDNVQYAPTQGRYKVYLIDEVHMLSKSSFNALLKTLEEPPAHVKFLLATTDPHKLPITVLSRCLQFNLLRLTSTQIQQHLAHILDQEGIEFEPTALALIAKSADGSARDSLSLLDQAIAYCGGKIQFQPVQTMLGLVDQGVVQAILQALIDQSSEQVKQILQTLASLGVDYVALLNQVLEALHQIAQSQILGEILEDTQLPSDLLQGFAQNLSPEQVQMYYQIGLLARQDMKLAPDVRVGFEMTLLRMLAFQPMTPSSGQGDKPSASVATPKADSAPSSAKPISDLLNQVVQNQTPPAQPKSPAPAPEPQPTPQVQEPGPESVSLSDFPGLQALKNKVMGNAVPNSEPPVAPVARTQEPAQPQVMLQTPPLQTPPAPSVPMPSAPEPQSPGLVMPQADINQPPAPQPIAQQAPLQQADLVSGQSNQPVAIEQWLALIQQVQPEGMAMELARQSVLIGADHQAWWLSLDPQHAAAKTEPAVARLTEAAQRTFGADFKIHFVDYAGEFFTPSRYDMAQQQASQQNAAQSIYQDPNVQQLQQGLDMQLLESSIQPLTPQGDSRH
jgi:DNA polymerase-3 subunit gamma/tau